MYVWSLLVVNSITVLSLLLRARVAVNQRNFIADNRLSRAALKRLNVRSPGQWVVRSSRGNTGGRSSVDGFCASRRVAPCHETRRRVAAEKLVWPRTIVSAACTPCNVVARGGYGTVAFYRASAELATQNTVLATVKLSVRPSV